MSKKTFLKLGLISAILFGLWRLWEDDAAINAFILFCTAGIVPGTNVELTPEQVYIVLGTTLFLAIVLIFAKELVRDMRAVRSAWHQWRQKPEAIMAAEVAPSDAVIETVSASQPSQLAKKRSTVAEPKPVVVIALPAQPGHLAKLWRIARPKLIIVVGASLEFLLNAANRGAILASRASLRLYGYGMQAWLCAEPYLRRFDKWLEHTLKSNKDTAAVLHVWSAFLKTTNARYLELRARLARVPRAPEE